MNEITLLAILLFLEAGGEPYAGKIMVAEVVQNRRVKSGKSWKETMLAPKQFSCFNNRKKLNKMLVDIDKGKYRDDQIFNDCLMIAKTYVKGNIMTTTPATHYYAHDRLKAPPCWAASMDEVARVGGHVFMVAK